MTIKWFRYDCRPGAPKPTYGYTVPGSKEILVREIMDGDASKYLAIAALAASFGMEGLTVTIQMAEDDAEITLRRGNAHTKDIVIATKEQWRIEILKTFHRLGWFPDHLVFKEEYR